MREAALPAAEELRGILAGLSPERLAELRDFAELLRAKDRVAVPIVLRHLFGTLPPEGAPALEGVIHGGCERMDGDTW